MSLAIRDESELIGNSRCEIFRFFPGVLKSPDRCANEIFGLARKLEVFVENKNVVLLEFAEIVKKRRSNSRASALCKSRMNDEA